MTAGLTYWRCPECGTRVGWTERQAEFWFGDETPTLDGWPEVAIVHAEDRVEAHEAKHLGGGV